MGLRFLSGSPAARNLRMKASGSCTSNSTVSWMWRACLKKGWSLHLCLSRWGSLLMSRSERALFQSWWRSWQFACDSGTRESDTGALPSTRRTPAAPSCPTPAVSVWRQNARHLEPGQCLSRRTFAQPNPPVHQGWLSLWVRPNSGAPEDQLLGRDLETGAENGVGEKATHGGGADVGNVDQGGDVGH